MSKPFLFCQLDPIPRRIAQNHIETGAPSALFVVGIADQVKGKSRQIPAAPVGDVVAKGEAEIGVTFLSEMNDPGVEVVGPLPRKISTPTTLVGFVSSHSKDPVAAKALLDYLSSPDAAATYKANGMQPGR